ncbi:MAG: M15 family metallopeptidase [Legionellaceae bacterium]|nr:M15 family metallopeptidase [Legionellaceae bacterium]MBP9775210.1 M15 family metallopeptidase [Legionellaceae bacterium]
MALATPKTILLITDPKILSIAIGHSDEPLVDIKRQGGIIYGPSPEIPNNQDYTFLRQTVYHKLVAAQKHLPPGYHFCLYEGYRSMALQKMLFDTHYANVSKRHPNWTATEIFQETIKLVSPVVHQDGTPNIPPHSTGAAVDVYLLDDSGHVLDMGIHPKDWMSDDGGVLSLTASHAISATAKKNREIMAQALSAEGFVNYPTEYWHWSYGDRYWAYMTHHSKTIYDQIIP